MWDFGDGNMSFNTSPSHNYNSNGTYRVCLKVLTQNGEQDEYCKEVTVGVTSLYHNEKSYRIEINPNPTNAFVELTFNDNILYNSKGIIYDLLGNEIDNFVLSHNQYFLDLTDIPAGFYLLVVKNNNLILSTNKFIKVD